jgi:MFS family permease
MFWFGQMVSLIGSWMQMTGQAWLVLTLTDSPFKLGLVSALQWTPVLLLSLFAGVVADRYPKRRILVITQSGLCVMAFVLAALTLSGKVQYWHVLITATCVGTLQAFDMPTRQSFVVEMAGRDDLLNAIALNSTIFNLARVIGPALAGLVVKEVGIGWAFALNGLSFFAVIYALRAMDVPDLVRPREGSAVSHIVDGLRYIGRTPLVLGIMILLAVISIFALNFQVLVPTLARNALHGDSGQYGLLMSCMGVGALLGSVCLATFGGRGPQTKAILAGAVLLGLGEMALLFARGWAFAGLSLFVCGAAMVTFSASANTTIQWSVPDELRGRVMSVHALVFGGTTPFGAFIAGTLAQRLGASATFGIIGGVAVLSAVAVGLSRLLAPVVARPPAPQVAPAEPFATPPGGGRD